MFLVKVIIMLFWMFEFIYLLENDTKNGYTNEKKEQLKFVRTIMVCFVRNCRHMKIKMGAILEKFYLNMMKLLFRNLAHF